MGAIAIFRKELNIYFTTWIAYGGLGAYALILGSVFVSSLSKFQQYTEYYLAQQQPALLEKLNFNDGIIGPLFSTSVWLFLFFVPFLTMRLFAEEKQARTFELLLTAPITSFGMVIGKFAAVAVIIAVMTSIGLIFPAILAAYGTGSTTSGGVEWAPVWSGLLSVLLLGLAFASIGLMISALTESQIVAALLTFAVLLMSFVLPMIAARIEGDWRAVIEWATPVSHVGRGLEGRLALRDLVYFGSAIVAFTFITTRVVESHRWR
jgi:ABC-2 type transport system permease protein